MNTVVIVHGYRGKPDTNWKPWLKTELETYGVEVLIPEMPNTNTPIASEWEETLTRTVGEVDGDVYLVGHSLGCITILRYLENLAPNIKIKACIFVAGFTGNFLKYEGGHDSFFDRQLNWSNIMGHCDTFVAIHSTDDQNVEVDQLALFNQRLAAKTIRTNGKGHFGSPDGVYELPLVRDELLALMRK